MPWGLNPSSGGEEGHSWNSDQWAKVVRDKMHAAVEFGDATGRHAVGRAHLCDQEAAVFKGHEVVGHARFHGFGGEHKTRLLRIGYVEEEDAVLIFQQAEQSSASQDGLGRIQVAVVRLVAGVAGRR